MNESVATSVVNIETKLSEAISSIEDQSLLQALQNIKDLIWNQIDVINDMDEIAEGNFENFAQNFKTIESNEAGISLIVNLLNANFKNADEFKKYQKEKKENSEELSVLTNFNLCFLRFYGKYIENKDFDGSFLENFLYGVEIENISFLAYDMVRETSVSGILSDDFASKMNHEKHNAVFWIYFTIINDLLCKIDQKEEFCNDYWGDIFYKLNPIARVLGKDRFNKFLYEKLLNNDKKLNDFMDAWFKAKNSDILPEDGDSVCKLMQDWERVYQNINLKIFMKFFVSNIEATEEIKKFFLNSFDESFDDLHNLNFNSIESCKNWINEKIDNSSLEDKRKIKEFFDNNIFRSRFFKKAIEDKEFLNFVSKDDKNFRTLKKCYDENSKLFYNRDVAWETKVKVTLIKEGNVFRDDTSLAIGEVNRTSVIERMDKKPELTDKEIPILFELSSRSWWWNRSLFLKLSKDDFTKLADMAEKIRDDKKFFDWIYSNRSKLIIKTRDGNKLVPDADFLEKVNDAGFFVLSENQKKVFKHVPEKFKEEFKNNFTQHPEFRATVELLGKTITDTESFIELYSVFVWAYNLLLNSSIQLSFAMAFVMGNAMAQFLKGIKGDDKTNIKKEIDQFEICNRRNYKLQPQTENQSPTQIQI